MCADSNKKPLVHFVGSIPLTDTESVFRALCETTGQRLARVPDGETGIRKDWIRFLHEVIANSPAIELASDLPPFRWVQWDGKLVREIPRRRVKPGMMPKVDELKSGYADMAIESWALFDKMQKAGTIPAGVKFQICLPTPIAPTYNAMIPESRQKLLPALTQHFLDEVARIARELPNDRIAIQWDVCQEVLAWEGYYDPGPVDFRTETLDVLAKVGNGVPEGIDLGFHLCYGSPANEHILMPKDTGIMVEMINAMTPLIKRPIQFFHLPVPKDRTDDAYFEPLKNLKLGAGTDIYMGLVHHDDAEGNAARLAAAQRYARVDGIAMECGMGRDDPARLPAVLKAHMTTAETAPA